MGETGLDGPRGGQCRRTGFWTSERGCCLGRGDSPLSCRDRGIPRGAGSAPALPRLLAVSQPCCRAFLIQAATVLRLSCSCRRDLRSRSVSAPDRVAWVRGEDAEVGL